MGLGLLQAQETTIVKWVVGSGGMVSAVNSSGEEMSGITGQAAIEKVGQTINSKEWDVYQGFWVPAPADPNVGVEEPIVEETRLSNYPNPFSYSTTINYELPGAARVSLKIYDVAGNEIATLVRDELREGGTHSVTWDAKNAYGADLSSGSYLLELSAQPAQMAGGPGFGSFVERKVMILVK